ncbi:hypothetical protein ZIOFF_055737 [Zingiber officinale]|uniref:Pentatricopeptide repeat-containing protein n=1 Tax=Zingiber officinale TaxID=94328 RepID=A0A8J5FCK0_ZINOF|nr:hypothetical protein ZIOFF_055737 [Zingiber officinale]
MRRRRLLTSTRSFSTRYSGRIVRADSSGGALAVEVDPPNLPRDVRGHPLPRRDLVCRAARILRSASPVADPLLDLTDYFQTLNIIPTTSEVSEILKSVRGPDRALEFFRFAASLPGFRHDCFTYNRILSILGRAGEKYDQSIREILDEMDRDGVRGNISTVNILISIVGGGEINRCSELVKKMEFDVYWIHLQVLDAGLYMKCCHSKPDAYTYTILIRMLGRLGKTDEFISLFEEMIVKGCTLNIIVYNTMLEALAKNHMVDKAFFVFSKMMENGCQPNEFTYSIFVFMLAAEGQLVRLDQVVDAANKYLNKSIYAYLVKTLSKLGHVSEAHRMFCRMWSFHDSGDRAACLSMLETLCSAGKTSEAMELLAKINDKGINADTVMYNMVFSALGKLKQVSCIYTLYEEMKTSGLLPSIFTYNILISSFGRVGLIDKASEVFEEMERNDCNPDIVSYNSLINCLGKNGELDEAHMRFMEMQEKGLNPDVVTYSTLIECFGKSNKIEMACRLFDEMLAEGCTPNIVTYNILLDCLEKSGKTAEAYKLHASLKQHGLTPDSITYSILERLASQSHNVVRVHKQSGITGWVVSPLR